MLANASAFPKKKSLETANKLNLTTEQSSIVLTMVITMFKEKTYKR